MGTSYFIFFFHCQYISHFPCGQIHLLEKFLEVDFLGQRVWASVILTHIVPLTKGPFLKTHGTAPWNILRNNSENPEGTFSFFLAVHCWDLAVWVKQFGLWPYSLRNGYVWLQDPLWQRQPGILPDPVSPSFTVIEGEWGKWPPVFLASLYLWCGLVTKLSLIDCEQKWRMELCFICLKKNIICPGLVLCPLLTNWSTHRAGVAHLWPCRWWPWHQGWQTSKMAGMGTLNDCGSKGICLPGFLTLEFFCEREINFLFFFF